MAKRQGQHPEKALSAVQIKALRKPGRYADGHGLYLRVDPSGAKGWILRITSYGEMSSARQAQIIRTVGNTTAPGLSEGDRRLLDAVKAAAGLA